MKSPHEPAGDVRTAWGQQKRQRSLSLTDVCWQLLTEQACLEGTNRSDLIERWARSASPIHSPSPRNVREPAGTHRLRPV
jgi:hypothetical protein